MKVAKIIYQELEIGAVAITDREKYSHLLVLALITIAREHRFRRVSQGKLLRIMKLYMPMAMKLLTSVH